LWRWAARPGDVHALLDAEDFEVAQFEIAGNTRQSLAVIETSTRRQYRFQLPGPDWPPEQTSAMLEHLRPHLTRGRIVVMSGSLPPGVPADIACDRQQAGGRVRIAADPRHLRRSAASSGEQSRSALRAARMDGAEATEVSGSTSPRPANWPITGQQLVGTASLSRLVMSMGAKGTVGVSADERFFCQPPKSKR
jgi:6-phosphofructokinase 2